MAQAPNNVNINYNQIDRYDLDRDIKRASDKVEELKPIYASMDDIHKHTKDPLKNGEVGVLGKGGRFFLELIKKYQLLPPPQDLPSFEQVASEINKHFAFSNYPNAAVVLSSITNAPGEESETGLNMQNVLVTTWYLAEILGDKKKITYNGKSMGLKEMIIFNMHLNIADEGGCDAGIAGRLTQPLGACTFFALQFKKNNLLIESKCNNRSSRHKEKKTRVRPENKMMAVSDDMSPEQISNMFKALSTSEQKKSEEENHISHKMPSYEAQMAWALQANDDAKQPGDINDINAQIASLYGSENQQPHTFLPQFENVQNQNNQKNQNQARISDEVSPADIEAMFKAMNL